jgi:hypothetical protein
MKMSARVFAAGVSFALLGACGGSFETASNVEAPVRERHPDGVLIDPPFATPLPRERAEARGVVALKEPVPLDAIRDLVRVMLGAFAHEDTDALARLFTRDAVPLGLGRAAHLSLLDSWRVRFKRYDYAKMNGVDVVDIDHIERFDYDDLTASGDLKRPLEMRDGDLLVRVPITIPRIDGDALFGDVMILLLRWDEGRWKIAGEQES